MANRARLADEMAVANITIPPWAARVLGSDYVEKVRAEIKFLPVFVADNVAEFLYAENPKEKWEKEDFPCVAPPFPRFWMEYRRPSKIVSDVHGTRSSNEIPYHTGFFFRFKSAKDDALLFKTSEQQQRDYLAAKMSDLENYLSPANRILVSRILPDDVTIKNPNSLTQEEWEKLLHGLHRREEAIKNPVEKYAGHEHAFLNAVFSIQHWHEPGFIAYLADRLAEHGGWAANVETFMQIERGGEILGPEPCYSISLGMHGDIRNDFRVLSYGAAKDEKELEMRRLLINSGSAMIWPALLALSMLNCKNVRKDEARQPETFRQAWRKKHKTDLVRYHVLHIDPLKEVVVRERKGGADNAVKKALHICRGHFKRFGKKGLFGKYHGLYWWDAFMRGDKSRGVVTKDYSVDGVNADARDHS